MTTSSNSRIIELAAAMGLVFLVALSGFGIESAVRPALVGSMICAAIVVYHSAVRLYGEPARRTMVAIFIIAFICAFVWFLTETPAQLSGYFK